MVRIETHHSEPHRHIRGLSLGEEKFILLNSPLINTKELLDKVVEYTKRHNLHLMNEEETKIFVQKFCFRDLLEKNGYYLGMAIFPSRNVKKPAPGDKASFIRPINDSDYEKTQVCVGKLSKEQIWYLVRR